MFGSLAKQKKLSVVAAMLMAAGSLVFPIGCSASKAREDSAAQAVESRPSSGASSMAAEKKFENVPLNTNEPCACSPKEPSQDWRGILIAAPANVSFGGDENKSPDGAFARVPICGFYMLDAYGAPTGAMVLHAENVESGEKFSGAVGEDDPSPDEPPPPTEPHDYTVLEGVSVEGYFNPNLAKFVQLPQESATYKVHVEWGKKKSNVVTIELSKSGS